MLAKCREAASTEGLNPHLVQADMRDLQFRSEFDAIIVMWNSFGYLESDADDQKVLDGISSALKPGGRLLLDYLHNRDTLSRRFEPRSWHENEAGDILLTEASFDVKTGRIHARELCLYSDGRRSEFRHSLRVYTYGELQSMLTASGMAAESVWGGRDRSQFTADSKGMEIVAIKAGGETELVEIEENQ